MLWGYHFDRLMCIILLFFEICIGKNLEGAQCVQRNHKLTVTVKFYGSRMWQYPPITREEHGWQSGGQFHGSSLWL